MNTLKERAWDLLSREDPIDRVKLTRLLSDLFTTLDGLQKAAAAPLIDHAEDQLTKKPERRVGDRRRTSFDAARDRTRPARLALVERLRQHAYDLTHGGTNASELRADLLSAAMALQVAELTPEQLARFNQVAPELTPDQRAHFEYLVGLRPEPAADIVHHPPDAKRDPNR